MSADDIIRTLRNFEKPLNVVESKFDDEIEEQIRKEERMEKLKRASAIKKSQTNSSTNI